jgi:hypothetical protein
LSFLLYCAERGGMTAMRYAGVILGLAIAVTCWAAQPPRVNYQAKLNSSVGLPITGTHTFYFSIWHGGDDSLPNLGANVYAESVSLNISNGIVNHEIGAGVATSGTLTPNVYLFNGNTFLQVAVDSPGNVILPRTLLESVPFAVSALNAPASLFGQFGGDGSDGDLFVGSLSTANLTTRRHQYRNATVQALGFLSGDAGWNFIGVQGTLSVAGTISADGFGEAGGTTTSDDGNDGLDASGLAVSQVPVLRCASGGGGGGGNSTTHFRGVGGGGQGYGGNGGDSHTNFVPLLVAGGVSSAAGSGETLTSDFQPLLMFRGAGGGAGASTMSGSGGKGGKGGGVIYIECDKLIFTGTITAKGENGSGSVASDGGGGGGGGGGIILVRARQIVTNTGTVTTAGGSGGLGGPGGGSSGDSGAAGFWDIVQIH